MPMQTKLIFVFIAIWVTAHSQRTEYPGIITSYTQSATIINPAGNNPHFAIDGQIQTYWESENPLPDKFIQQKTLNIFNLEAENRPISIVNAAFDGNLNTAVNIGKANESGEATLKILLENPDLLQHIALKASINQTLSVAIAYTDKTKQVETVSSDKSYQLVTIKPNTEKAVEAITISSGTGFQLFELAAMNAPPFVDYTLDLKSQKTIGQCYSRHLNSENLKDISLFLSEDGSVWKLVASLNSKAINLVPTLLETSTNARFVRMRFHLGWENYAKAALWDLKLYDEFGPYGPPSVFRHINKPLNERIGLNMVWGWGQHVYSDQITNGKGWKQYENHFKKLRIYHNLLWDIPAPGISANYQQMQLGKGTAANWWLDWNREYGFLTTKGFELTSTLMFKNRTIPESLWKNPAEDANNIGSEFGQYFSQHQLIEAVEAGNEPWDYPPDFYQKTGSNMASGLKNSAPRIMVLPAAFQSSFPNGTFNDQHNFLPDFIHDSFLQNVDALNVHFYAHAIDQQGVRIAVPPEDRRAEIQGIRNIIRYRNELATGKEVWVTEFGYDGSSKDEPCLHSECVSEAQQAAWGVRAALYLLREGANRVYWYFYANEATESYLHSRSGLTLSANHNFKPKASWFAFRDLLQYVGNASFTKVIVASEMLIAYQFEDFKTRKKYIIAWIPHNGPPEEGQYLKLDFLETARKKFMLDGKAENQWIKLENKTTIFLSGYPTLFEI